MIDRQTRHFYEQVMRLIRREQMLDSGDLVVVAVSGGIDSVVLLYVLTHLQQRLGIHVHCAHLNHQFRGQEAERDAAFVQRFSAQLHIPCSLTIRDVPEFAARNKLSSQDAARQVRYEFLTTLADQLGATKIATAHTADDQAETVLLGLIRGVGLQGLGGIQPVLKLQSLSTTTIIRPLLDITRDGIVAFARHKELDYVEDSSNTSRKYTRNAIRLDLLPLLKQQFNPAIVRRLGMYARRFREDAECLERIAYERYNDICKNVPPVIKINLDLFAKECITIQRALVYICFEKLTNRRHILESQHARAVIGLFTLKPSGQQVSLPGGIKAYRSSAWGYLTAQKGTGGFPERTSLCCESPGTYQSGALSIEALSIEALSIEIEIVDSLASGTPLSMSVPGREWEQFMDADQVKFPITVRYRRAGDAFQPLGMQGKKRVKKFFIDRKIPRHKRECIPLFEDADGIFWIVGQSIDERVKITPQTVRYLRCRVSATGEHVHERK